MSILAALLSAVAEFLGIRRAKVEAAQTPAMQANAAAKTDASTADRADDLIAKAAGGDADALKELQRLAGE